MINIIKWSKKNIRPHFRYKGTEENEGKIDILSDDGYKVKEKIEKFTEIGVKVKIKF